MQKPSVSELQTQVNVRLIEELSQQKREFSTLINLLEEIVFRCDTTGRIELLNPSWARKLGYPVETSIGQSLLDHVPNNKTREALRSAFAENNPITFEIQMTTGFSELRSFILRASRDDEAWYGSLIDITDQQLTLRALRDSEQRSRKLSLVAQSTDNIVIITDAEGRIDWVNEGFERATGYQLAEVRGRTPGDFLQGPGSDLQTIAHMRKAISRGLGFEVEIINYSKQGEPYWVAIDCQPVHTSDGQIESFIAIERDISASKQAEVAMRKARDEAQSLSRARTRFVANMSHEIRTPLNAILGMSSLLDETNLTTEQRTCIETIQNSGKALLALVNDVLDFSKLECGKLPFESITFPLDQAMEEAVDIVAPVLRDKGLALHLTCGNDVPSQIVGDPDRLRQVVLNLLSNAVKFTREGEISIHVDWTALGGDRGKLCVDVRDTGIGIEPDRVETLFDEFTQADPSITREFGGTGLGLAICRQICEQTGGRIWATSQQGVGSCFSFEMQVEQGAPLSEKLPNWTLAYTGLPDSINRVIVSMASWLQVPVSRAAGNTADEKPRLEVILHDGSVQPLVLDDLYDIVTPRRLRKLAAITAKQLSAEARQVADDSQAGANIRVLVAEDVAANQLVLRFMLERLGCTDIKVVDDGQQAVDAAREATFDLVLTDMHMPVMDGLQAARQIRDLPQAHCPMIVAVSADATTDAQEAADAAGIDGWLSKPVSKAALANLLRDLKSHLAAA